MHRLPATVGPAIAGLLLFYIYGLAIGADNPPEIKIVESWSGEVKLELRKQAPDAGFIAEAKSWEKLWKTYRGDEKVPLVDFKEHIILVGVNSDPNQIGAVAKLGEKGDLRVMYAGTLIGFIDPKTCAYQFAMISRHGIKSVNGMVMK
ncbi:hypothetical protein ETAA8_41880 [Anatilimnocola aggregata]|uniref:Uncharacterized protein n=1 Tax=Anatilimnocola aggregata TaxID=2528021 RepID=A0A517YFV2_9BACT|nr:hypothetical protein [Anatilimnocola aggregata]QDU29081.1 hypothetical protein ETAA8_41880 [Anatilimnocola aggregata]